MIALVVLFYFLYGSLFTIGKLALTYVNAIFFIGLRTTIAGALLLAFQYLYNRNDFRRIAMRDWFLLLQVTLFHIVFVYVPEYWGLKYVTAAKASLVFSVFPFITALLAHLILHESLKKIQWLGLLIGSIGFIPILLTQQLQEQALTHIGFLSTPEIMLLLAATSLAYGWILMKKAMVQHNYSANMLNGISMLAGGLISMGMSCAIEGKPAITIPTYMIINSFDVYENAFASLVLLVCLSFSILIFCYSLYSYLLKHYTATFLSFTSFIAPVFTAFFDWVLMGIMVSTNFVISMVIVTIGLFLFHHGEDV